MLNATRPGFLSIATVFGAAALGFAAPLLWYHAPNSDGGLTGTAEAQTRNQLISGRATIIDGDTIAVEGIKARIRLYGIDAPESKQTCDDAAGRRYLCGSKAADYLTSIIGRNGRVQCFEEDRDRYGRIVAECATPGNVVINAVMVEAGWAVEYDTYSDGRYDQEEQQAKATNLGLWAGKFVEPSKWRRGERLASEQPKAVDKSAACQIKGNISGSGKIYHVPGSKWHERTQVDESKGERWFCSEAEAKTAGWRAPRG